MTQRVNFANALIVLFILSLQTSMSAMDFFASLLFIFTLVSAFQLRDSILKNLSYLIPRLVFIAVGGLFFTCLIGFLFFAHLEAPKVKVLFEFKWFLFLMVLTLFFNYFYSFKTLKNGFLFTFYLVLLYASLAYVFKFDLFGDLDSLNETTIRVGGFFSNPMTFAHSFQFFVFFFLSAVLMYFSNLNQSFWLCLKNKKFLAMSLLSLLGIAMIFLSMTRGVWIGLIIALGCGLILHFRKQALKPIVAMIVLLGLTILLSPQIQHRIVKSFNPQKSYDSERLVLWKTNWKIFLENPIFGIGYGENKRLLRLYYDKYDVPQGQFEGHAHNQYLHFLAGTGVLGLVFYLLLFVYFIFLSAKIYITSMSSEVKMIALGSFMGLLCFFVGGLTESNFQHAKLKYMLVFVWSLLLYLRSKQVNSRELA